MISLGTNFFLISFLYACQGNSGSSSIQNLRVVPLNHGEWANWRSWRKYMEVPPGINQISGDVGIKRYQLPDFRWRFASQISIHLLSCFQAFPHTLPHFLEDVTKSFPIRLNRFAAKRLKHQHRRQISQSRSPSQRGSGLKGIFHFIPLILWISYVKRIQKICQCFLSNVELGGGLSSSNQMSTLKWRETWFLLLTARWTVVPTKTNQNLKELGET